MLHGVITEEMFVISLFRGGRSDLLLTDHSLSLLAPTTRRQTQVWPPRSLVFFFLNLSYHLYGQLIFRRKLLRVGYQRKGVEERCWAC